MASELLKRAVKATLTNAETVLLNGVDGHTYTILSITFCETAGAAETFDLYIDIGGAGTDIEIYSDQALGANETFEHTGRIVLEDEDHLCAATASSISKLNVSAFPAVSQIVTDKTVAVVPAPTVNNACTEDASPLNVANFNTSLAILFFSYC